MKSLQIYLFLFLSVFALGACIQNDIPYPYIKGEITAFEVEGQTGGKTGITIDTSAPFESYLKDSANENVVVPVEDAP